MKERILTLGLVAALLSPIAALAVADEHASAYADPQLRRLFQPSEREREREQQGQVFIYDGLDGRNIDRAMNDQFARVDSMMFVRTRVENEDGEEEVLEDGCE